MQDTWHSELFPDRHQVQGILLLVAISTLSNLLFFMTWPHTMHWTPQTAQIIMERGNDDV